MCGPGGTLVDVGCANGGLLRELGRLGVDGLIGVDPASACVAATAAVPGVTALEGSLAALPASAGPCDGVVLSHVLEHVRDLDEAIAEVLGILAPEGFVYVEVPDATQYPHHLAAPFQDFNTEHINHFSPATLERLMARHGLAPVAAGDGVFEGPVGCSYPITYGVFRRAAGAGPRAPRVDEPLRHALRTYVEDSRALLARTAAKLEQTWQATPDVIVWGTGQLCMKLLGETRLGDCAVHAFIDANPVNQGARLLGVPVLSPERALDLPRHPIVIASTIHEQEIVDAIRGLGLDNPLVRLREDR